MQYDRTNVGFFCLRNCYTVELLYLVRAKGSWLYSTVTDVREIHTEDRNVYSCKQFTTHNNARRLLALLRNVYNCVENSSTRCMMAVTSIWPEKLSDALEFNKTC